MSFETTAGAFRPSTRTALFTENTALFLLGSVIFRWFLTNFTKFWQKSVFQRYGASAPHWTTNVAGNMFFSKFCLQTFAIFTNFPRVFRVFRWFFSESVSNSHFLITSQQNILFHLLNQRLNPKITTVTSSIRLALFLKSAGFSPSSRSFFSILRQFACFFFNFSKNLLKNDGFSRLFYKNHNLLISVFADPTAPVHTRHTQQPQLTPSQQPKWTDQEWCHVAPPPPPETTTRRSCVRRSASSKRYTRRRHFRRNRTARRWTTSRSRPSSSTTIIIIIWRRKRRWQPTRTTTRIIWMMIMMMRWVLID